MASEEASSQMDNSTYFTRDDELRQFLFHKFMENSNPYSNPEDPKLNDCFIKFIETFYSPENISGCPVKFDGVSCWDNSPPAVLSVIPCFAELNGIPYDTSENATLYCTENSTWADRSFYNMCVPIDPDMLIHSGKDVKLSYYIGNSLSLVAVLIALYIFVSFKDLRCLRNKIHSNLLATYLLHSLFWIISAALHIENRVGAIIGCSVFVALNYAILTNFFWMFVEGLYLYMLVVNTFSVENIKLRIYVIIGWGISIPIVISWIAIRAHFHTKMLDSLSEIDAELMESSCFLVTEDITDWILRGPVLFVLTSNIVFLVRIMWVLITKLRSANTVETQRYWKASKALLVLIPLLGITYMLVIVLPEEFSFFRSILLSTQGFWVAIFYCFLNSEVRNSIRHHIDRWRTKRGIAQGRGLSSRQCKDSPSSNRDRFTNYGRRFFGGKHRESSCCSEVTTMSTFVTNGYNSQTTFSAPPQSAASNSQSAAASVLQQSTTSSPQKNERRCSDLSLQPMTSESQATSPVSGSTTIVENVDSNLKDALL